MNLSTDVKEVNEKYPYHEIKPHTTVSAPGDAYNTLEGDVLSVKTKLGVTCEKKSTSCPDQLALALKMVLEQEQKTNSQK